MHVEYHKWWSRQLGRDMEYQIYGHDGHTMIAFPSQDGRFFDFAERGMIHQLTPWIEAGKLRVVCVDGIDWETWSASGDYHGRISRHERWFWYIIEELLPNIQRWPGETMMVAGCSMGAFHAANFFFRRPDLFDTLIAMSGLFHASYSFPGYNDPLIYANSPQDFLPNMGEDHPWIQLYRQRQIWVLIGQGRWEEDTLWSTRQLDTILAQKHVPAHFEYWGADMDHDWPAWQRMLPRVMQEIIPL